MKTTVPSTRPGARRVRAPRYARVPGPHGTALVCIAPQSPVELLIEWLGHLDGPLLALYLLLEESNDGPPAARYQSPFPTRKRKLTGFLERFTEFLEQDGRHAIWIMDEWSKQRLIFDRHDLLFAYGPLDPCERALVRRGYTPGPTPGRPASHRAVEGRFDVEAELLHGWWPWIPTPLWPGDDL